MFKGSQLPTLLPEADMSKAGVLLAILVLFVTGCATGLDDIETPSGPIEGDFFEQMQVLGVSARQSTSLNEPNSNDPFEEEFDIQVPVGTQVILPVIRGWRLGFGKIVPNTLEAHTGAGTWITENHKWGLGRVRVTVIDINAPDFSTTPPTQTATISVLLNLSDDNKDQEWFGLVDYSLIHLGLVENAVPILPFKEFAQ